MSWTGALAAYEQVQKGALEAERQAELGVTKRKKEKGEETVKLLVIRGTSKKNREVAWPGQADPGPGSLQKDAERQQMEMTRKKTTKTHKQRLQEFTRHLEALWEHCDIQSQQAEVPPIPAAGVWSTPRDTKGHV